jgi:hypothetical protein
MKKTILIVASVIGGIALIGLGFYSGSYWVKQQTLKAGLKSPITTLMASKVIQGDITTTASGEVIEISGRNLILNKEESSFTILVGEGAGLHRQISSKEEAEGIPQPVSLEEIKFEEIKIGDQVSIFCVLKPDGSLEGKDVMILPQ